MTNNLTLNVGLQSHVSLTQDWGEKYKPNSPADFLLTSNASHLIESFQTGHTKFLLLAGPPGLGKTTIAKVLTPVSAFEVLWVEGASDSGVTFVRKEIRKFASQVSLFGQPQVIVIDEVDNFTDRAQAALKGSTMQHVSFLLTCNDIKKVIEPIRSRCVCVDFSHLTPEDRADLRERQFSRACTILSSESVKYDESDVWVIVDRHPLDMRALLLELQALSGPTKSIPKQDH